MGGATIRAAAVLAAALGLAFGTVSLGTVSIGTVSIGTGATAPEDGDLKELERALRAPYPDARARAVRKLALLRTEAAWERVIGALEDREPQVADEAQLALGGVRAPKVVDRLLGKDGLRSRREVVRLRVAEAFGRMSQEVDGTALARALDPDPPQVARALVWSLERLARGGRLAGDRLRVARRLEVCLARRCDPHLRADALAALSAVAPERAWRHVSEGLADREPAVRCAALIQVAARGEPSAFGVAERLAGDEAPSVRHAAVGVLQGFGNRSALEVLAARLEVEPREHVLVRAVAALRSLTGMRYGADPRPWKRFVAGLPADWRAGQGPPPRERPAQVDTRADLGHFPLASDRVAILVDLSGSLWAERQGGRTRKELLDGELSTLLQSLPESSEFQLIPYATDPKPWRDGLVRARPREVRAALANFERCRLTGKGNVWDAVMLALADPRVDTLLVVTDGAPTGGLHWHLELMVDLLVQECRWRGTTVHSVLVDASQRLRGSWERLALATGGRSIAVDFADEPEGGR